MLNTIRVIIVDDHPMVREGIKNSLKEFAGITVPGEAENGSELFKKLQKESFDIILLDLSLSGILSFDILEELKIKNIPTPVLVFSVYPEKDYALRVLRAGAKGYIHKQSNVAEIAGAIKKVASGKKYMSDTVQELLLSEDKKGILPHQQLSDRELEVMLYIYSGMSNKRMGAQLHISEKTISTYRTRLFTKMGFSNDAELIKYVIEHKLEPNG